MGGQERSRRVIRWPRWVCKRGVGRERGKHRKIAEKQGRQISLPQMRTTKLSRVGK